MEKGRAEPEGVKIPGEWAALDGVGVTCFSKQIIQIISGGKTLRKLI